MFIKEVESFRELEANKTIQIYDHLTFEGQLGYQYIRRREHHPIWSHVVKMKPIVLSDFNGDGFEDVAYYIDVVSTQYCEEVTMDVAKTRESGPDRCSEYFQHYFIGYATRLDEHSPYIPLKLKEDGPVLTAIGWENYGLVPHLRTPEEEVELIRKLFPDSRKEIYGFH
ncbi:MAG: hypothetical protein HQL51_13800 [Magnetococcales bacterium]|nr:hypothetical protein [Magnetococcales bacterium]